MASEIFAVDTIKCGDAVIPPAAYAASHADTFAAIPRAYGAVRVSGADPRYLYVAVPMDKAAAFYAFCFDTLDCFAEAVNNPGAY